MSVPRRADQALHAIALGEARRRRTATLARVDEATREPRHRGDTGVGGLVACIRDRNLPQARVGSPPVHQLEAAEIIGSGIGENEGAVLAVELDAMAGTEVRGAAHLQAAAGARREREHERNAALGVSAGQRKHPPAKSHDRTAEPFEIIEAVGDEIAEKAAAALAARLPARKAQPRGGVLDIPGDDHMAQAAERATVENLLRAPPRVELGKIEIDDGRSTVFPRGGEHSLGAGEIGRERLLDEYRLAETERAPRDLGLQVWRN